MNDPLKLLPVDVTKIRAQDVVVVAAVLVGSASPPSLIANY